jgi:hypothetical protein
VKQLQAAAQRHDVADCPHADCKRCAAARACGAMCALAGCCERKRASGKNLQRCGRCRTAAYCGAEHQADDWARHKPECSVLRDAKDNDDEA